MNSSHYVPRADAAFDAWQANFAQYAIDHSADLALSHADIEALELAQAAWTKGFGALPEFRAQYESAVQKKNTARAGYESLLRRIAGRIQHLPDITDAQRAALGLTIPDAVRTTAAPPETWPVLSIDAGTRLVHRIRFRDSDAALRRGKPRGVVAIELRQCLVPAGATVPTDPAAYTFAALASRSPVRINFPGPAAGQTAAYMARWINPRCAAGPWGDMATATVGG